MAAACLALSSVILNTIESNTYLNVLLNLNLVGNDILDDMQSLITLTRSLAGYMIFVAVVAFLVEVPTILGRFTLHAGNGMLRILHVVVRYFIHCYWLTSVHYVKTG